MVREDAAWRHGPWSAGGGNSRFCAASGADCARVTCCANPGALYELWQLARTVVHTDLPLDVVASLAQVGLGLAPDNIAYHYLQLNRHIVPWRSPVGAEVLLPVYGRLLPVLREFYQPVTDKRLRLEGPGIRVLNGTGLPARDRIAASQLVRDAMNAEAAGILSGEVVEQTRLIDYSGASKGSLSARIAGLLEIDEAQIVVDADPQREVDYEVILGEDYKTCRQPNVLRVREAVG